MVALAGAASCQRLADFASADASRKHCYLGARWSIPTWAIGHRQLRTGSPQAGEEQLLGRDGPRSEILLMHISADRRPGRPIGLETIGPEILAEHGPRLLH